MRSEGPASEIVSGCFQKVDWISSPTIGWGHFRQPVFPESHDDHPCTRLFGRRMLDLALDVKSRTESPCRWKVSASESCLLLYGECLQMCLQAFSSDSLNTEKLATSYNTEVFSAYFSSRFCHCTSWALSIRGTGDGGCMERNAVDGGLGLGWDHRLFVNSSGHLAESKADFHRFSVMSGKYEILETSYKLNMSSNMMCPGEFKKMYLRESERRGDLWYSHFPSWDSLVSQSKCQKGRSHHWTRRQVPYSRLRNLALVPHPNLVDRWRIFCNWKAGRWWTHPLGPSDLWTPTVPSEMWARSAAWTQDATRFFRASIF